MLETTKLPKVLWEFIYSAQHRLLEETDAEYVDYAIELVWLDQIYPMYTNIIFWVVGTEKFSCDAHCARLECELNDAKPEFLFDCVPAPSVIVKSC